MEVNLYEMEGKQGNLITVYIQLLQLYLHPPPLLIVAEEVRPNVFQDIRTMYIKRRRERRFLYHLKLTTRLDEHLKLHVTNI